MWVKRLQTDTDVLQNLRMFVQELKPVRMQLLRSTGSHHQVRALDPCGLIYPELLQELLLHLSQSEAAPVCCTSCLTSVSVGVVVLHHAQAF